MKKHKSVIDFCVGSSGEPVLAQKIKIMQRLQQEGWRVHVDYSEYANFTKDFLEENNVRFIIQVDEKERILLTDRFGYLS